MTSCEECLFSFPCSRWIKFSPWLVRKSFPCPCWFFNTNRKTILLPSNMAQIIVLYFVPFSLLRAVIKSGQMSFYNWIIVIYFRIWNCDEFQPFVLKYKNIHLEWITRKMSKRERFLTIVKNILYTNFPLELKGDFHLVFKKIEKIHWLFML